GDVVFFSSRRRHTRLVSDWSSDVCSSDLVRRRAGTEWKRGVVFVRELVPRLALAAVARLVYHEPYSAVPMRHAIDTEAGRIAYSWRWGRAWYALSADAPDQATLPSSGSDAEFITHPFWRYGPTPPPRT